MNDNGESEIYVNVADYRQERIIGLAMFQNMWYITTIDKALHVNTYQCNRGGTMYQEIDDDVDVDDSGGNYRLKKRLTRSEKRKAKEERILKNKFLMEVKPPVQAKTSVQREFLKSLNTHDVIVFNAPAGVGKCHGIGTKIRMYDLSLKAIEDIRVGDLVMGGDGTPRKVLNTTRGRGEMYEVSQVKGMTYTVNSEHLLSLRASFSDRGSVEAGKIYNMKVTDFLKKSRSERTKIFKGYQSSMENYMGIYSGLPHPYLLGVWLGDGTSTTAAITQSDNMVEILCGIREEADLHGYVITEPPSQVKQNCRVYSVTGGFKDFLRSYNLLGNKHIPKKYLQSTVSDRMKVLAGILDADGHLINNCFEVTQKNKQLAEDIILLARTLGFKVTSSVCTKSCQTGAVGEYWRIFISGDVGKIPVKCPYKKASTREQVKNHLNTGIDVRSIGYGDYYGIYVDGDNLYCLEDFTVTHNSFLTMSVVSDWLKKGEVNKVVLTRPSIPMGRSIGLLPGDLREKYEQYLQPLLQVLWQRYGKNYYESCLNNGSLELLPAEYSRGRSIDGVFILDEAQSFHPDEVYTLLTRLEEGGKIIMIGDPNQSDIRGENGIAWLKGFVEKNPDLKKHIKIINATSDDIVRSGLCKAMVKAREKEDQK